MSISCLTFSSLLDDMSFHRRTKFQMPKTYHFNLKIKTSNHGNRATLHEFPCSQQKQHTVLNQKTMPPGEATRLPSPGTPRTGKGLAALSPWRPVSGQRGPAVTVWLGLQGVSHCKHPLSSTKWMQEACVVKEVSGIKIKLRENFK